MIFGGLSFAGTRWYVVTVRDPKMVRDQKKLRDDWIRENRLHVWQFFVIPVVSTLSFSH